MFDKKQKEDPDLELFVIFDTKVGRYRDPYQAVNRFQMIRDLETMFRDPSQSLNQFVTNSEDFALFKIGEYNRKTGVVKATQHEHIANLHDLRAAIIQKGPLTKVGETAPLGIVAT